MRAAPGVVPLEAVQDEDIREVVNQARQKVGKMIDDDAWGPLSLEDFIKRLRKDVKKGKNRAIGSCFSMYIPFVGCYAVCCDLGFGKTACWWVCYR